MTRLRTTLEFEAEFESYLHYCSDNGLEASKDTLRDWAVHEISTSDLEKLDPGAFSFVTDDGVTVSLMCSVGPVATDSGKLNKAT